MQGAFWADTENVSHPIPPYAPGFFSFAFRHYCTRDHMKLFSCKRAPFDKAVRTFGLPGVQKLTNARIQLRKFGAILRIGLHFQHPYLETQTWLFEARTHT